MKGLGTALVTPFTEEGKIDFQSLNTLLEHQIKGGTDYLVILGTTSEVPTLTHSEQDEIIAHVVKQVAGRIPLVLGVGGNSTAAVVERLHELKETLATHFAGILSVTPYYNRPQQEGLYLHFCAVAEASPVPVILYNVPKRTGVNMLPDTVMRIHKAYPDKIMGIKEASGNVEQIKQLIALSKQQATTAEDALLVISGDDGIVCEIMKAGGAGLISVASNAFPNDFNRIVHNQDEALQAQYDEMVKLLFAEGNPVGIKAVLAQKGIITNHLRLPLVPASEELRKNIAALL